MDWAIADPDLHAAAIAEIYRPAVERSVASFEATAPGTDEMARRIEAVLRWTPWLVAVEGDAVLGYAYATKHAERDAYRWSVDLSAYVGEGHRGRGVGTFLYGHALRIIRMQGFVNAYAGITLPNPASVALHERIGMELVGVYRQVGYKAGDWHDVAWFGMRLWEPDGVPPEPIAFPDLPRDALGG
jgi:phosphinothricin acetyltransferase